jgi:hypothetical protein
VHCAGWTGDERRTLIDLLSVSLAKRQICTGSLSKIASRTLNAKPTIYTILAHGEELREDRRCYRARWLVCGANTMRNTRPPESSSHYQYSTEIWYQNQVHPLQSRDSRQKSDLNQITSTRGTSTGSTGVPLQCTSTSTCNIRCLY